MTSSTDWYRWEGEDLLLQLRVQPRASKDQFVGPYGDQYKVRITAPPVEGKANAHLQRFLAKAFGVGRDQVSLISGDSCKNKGFRIHRPQKFPISLTKPS
ncbi:DUF167 family protein [Sedimenticola sp.]|uniref:DUF167 family protein n=1 Tax=Sedimenticola sp. TaxID=1940285 RepID=UPI003D0A5F7A